MHMQLRYMNLMYMYQCHAATIMTSVGFRAHFNAVRAVLVRLQAALIRNLDTRGQYVILNVGSWLLLM